MTKYAAILLVGGLTAACSGSGVSTTARDDSGADSAATVGDDGGDDGDDDSSTPADDGGDDDGTPGTDGGMTDDGTNPTTGPGDTGNDDATTTAGECDEPVTLEGVWLSEGDNIAPLLVDLTNAVSITGTFTADTFTVLTIDSDGQMVNQSGVYTSEASGVGDIQTIVLEQTVPQSITVEGIYEVDNSVCPPIMTYEVVQTSPSVGAQTPTAELGFGGTNLGSDLTQIFVRQ